MTWNTNKEVGSSWNEPKSVKNSIIKVEPVKYSWQVQAVAAEVIDPLTTVDIVKPTTPVDIVEPVYPTIATTTCSDSSQCASGWVCSNGLCVENVGSPATGSSNPTQTSPSFQEQNPGYQPPNGTPGVPNSGPNSNTPVGARYPRGTGSGGGGGGFSGCGNDVIIDPNSGKTIARSKCGPDPSDNGCRKSGCGQDERAWDCCGESRCCRYSGAGVVCNCGECPEEENECNSFCSNYLSATGGLMPGCESAAVCDECEECLRVPGVGTQCAAKREGEAPCQCEGSKCGGACDSCGVDGTCFEDCDKCIAPYPTYARCSCGDFATTSYVNACGERIADAVDCSALCPDDPCLGDCKTVWKCDNSDFGPCPSETSCNDIGYLTIGNKTCGFRTECFKGNLPPECEECDCNCDDDCPDCTICSASGVCVDDPECDCDKCDCGPTQQPGQNCTCVECPMKEVFFTYTDASGGGDRKGSVFGQVCPGACTEMRWECRTNCSDGVGASSGTGITWEGSWGFRNPECGTVSSNGGYVFGQGGLPFPAPSWDDTGYPSCS